MPLSLIAFLIKNRWIFAVGAVVVLLALSNAHFYYKGRAAAQQECEAARTAELAERQAEVIAAQYKTFSKMVSDQKLSNEVANDYQGQIADIDARYTAELDRLRHDGDNANGGTVPDSSAAAGKCNGTAATNRLSRSVQENLIRLMRQADEQTSRLQACQDWAQRQAQ